MKLITERNLLYAYTPMDIHNPHKSKLTLPMTDKVNGTTVYQGVWGAEESMLIDTLADMVRITAYGAKKPGLKEVTTNISWLNSKKVEDHFRGDQLAQTFTTGVPPVPYARIMARYDFLRGYGPKGLHGLIERTSKIRLTCSYRYKVKETTTENDPTGKSRKTENLSKHSFKSSVPQSLFDFEYRQDTLSYEFRFTTGLGILFFNNILAAEWEWVPSELYSLSRNAQNLYRKYLLVKKQGTEIRLSVAQIAKTLKLMTANQTVRRKSVEGYLEELKAAGFIDYKVERGYRDFAIAMKKLVSN